MGSDGIMDQIRDLLAQGVPSGQAIQLGYAPGTVYKVQRLLRLEREKQGEPTPVVDQDQSISDGEGPEELSAEDAEFLRLFFGQEDEPDPEISLRAELEQEAGRVQALQERVDALEAEAEAGVALRPCIQKLEHQLKNAGQAQEDMRQSNLEWQSKFQAEQSARRYAEQRAGECQAQMIRWQQEYQLLQSKLEASAQVISGLRAEIQQLEPLKVWAGHPCSVCRKPMSDSVARDLATEQMKNLAHKGCLSMPGAGVGELLLAGGAVYGLSLLSKR